MSVIDKHICSPPFQSLFFKNTVIETLIELRSNCNDKIQRGCVMLHMLTEIPLKAREEEEVNTRCKVIGETAGDRESKGGARQRVKV